MNQTVNAYAPSSTDVIESARADAGGIFASIIRKFRTMQIASQTEAELSALSDSVLRDIGISRNEIGSFSQTHARTMLKR